jgi:hypothetical protein
MQEPASQFHASTPVAAFNLAGTATLTLAVSHTNQVGSDQSLWWMRVQLDLKAFLSLTGIILLRRVPIISLLCLTQAAALLGGQMGGRR